ncbi:MAG TPA: DUF2252 domain-containing protein [Ktedonobacteraceae bacterium]|nr:DUF2252 domain-containing protein [Ktedonobacteraceae bacterium]
MSIANEPLPVDEHSHQIGSVEYRRDAGKALRKQVSRRSHAKWSPAADRPDPISLLEEQNRSRLDYLVPLRFERMSASPFTFLRGTAIVMAADLAVTPVSGIRVQMCGDAHLNNFGIFATPERNQVFDLNDFDETLPGPWEWDVKRLAASIVIAGRNNGFSHDVNRQAVLNCIATYRQRMWEYGDMRHLEVWYSRIDYASSLEAVNESFRWWVNKQRAKAVRRTHVELLPKITEEVNGQVLIKPEPPLLTRLKDEELTRMLSALVEEYRTTLREDRHVLLSKYNYVDVVHKVVGVGSVGTRCYVALLLGNGTDDPLFLQIKEARASVYEPYVGRSAFSNHGERVVMGQRLMQASSGIFLGWTRLGPIDFYIRQLRDMKLSVDISTLSEGGFNEYAKFCGWALARAHARSGDPAMISGYLGQKDVFDQAIATFAELYADQAERDHAALVSHLQTTPQATLS